MYIMLYDHNHKRKGIQIIVVKMDLLGIQPIIANKNYETDSAA